MATLNTGNFTNLLPRQVSSDIWSKALEQAAIPRLTPDTPMVLGDNIQPVLTTRPSETIVAEGAQKKDSAVAIKPVVMQPVKAQVGLEFTLETIEANPAGVLGVLQTELAAALSRQVDAAIVHKLKCDDGQAFTTTSTSLSEVSQSQTLTTKPRDDVDTAYASLVDQGYDWTGTLFSPKMISALRRQKVAKDVDLPLMPELTPGVALDSFLGIPAASSRVVQGGIDGLPDQKLRGVIGDFSALRFGYALSIPVKRIEYGDPFGNGDLQRRNAIAFIAEIIFAWGVLDEKAFVKIVEA